MHVFWWWGSGLTALDVLSTLLKNGHRGKITVASRRGLRSKSQSPELFKTKPRDPQVPESPLERVMGPLPVFLQGLGDSCSLTMLLKRIRLEIRQNELRGGTWHDVLDQVRDKAWQLWPKLSTKDKKRFLGKLRVWYDVHRFRSPPQNEQLVAIAEKAGTVEFIKATIKTAQPGNETEPVRLVMSVNGIEIEREFDWVINCTGLESKSDYSDSPFLQSALKKGLLQIDESGLGFKVTSECAAVQLNGKANPFLRVIGPPTVGAHGDPLGVLFITAQVYRIIPSVKTTLLAIKHKLRETAS